MVTTVIIPSRFSGPPNSGNGGYTCGLISNALGGPAEVTLRKPIPIDRALQLHLLHDTTAALKDAKDADETIAEGKRFELKLEPALPVTFTQAEEAARLSPAFKDHPFPTCFVCGPLRGAGDGLRIFPGRLPAFNQEYDLGFFAAPWIPDASLANPDGTIKDEIIWAALDCPTGFAGGFPYEGKLVTGRLAARLLAPVHVGEKCVLVSWPMGIEGRKHHAAAALLGEDGGIRAEAKATWIKLD